MPKLLALGDDLRYFSGISIQTRKVLTGLVKLGWECVQIGYTRIRHSPEPVMVEGVKIYPRTNDQGYNEPQLVREVLQIEKPDVLWLFNDPRFYMWLFEMDSELRPHVKIVYWHLWDNDPFPRFNIKWYKCVDKVVAISKKTDQLLDEGKIPHTRIPHGLDGKEFYRIGAEKRKKIRKDWLKRIGLPDTEFIVFSNNRNQDRKRLSDIVVAFKRFQKNHPKSLLYMHSDIIDPDGVDLYRVIRDVEPGPETVIFNTGQLPHELVLAAYNISDVYVTIPYNEGFGLSVAESLLCETPVIATPTGGVAEQIRDGDQVFGIELPIIVRTLFGNIRDPYIYRDFSSIEDLEKALETAYQMRNKPEWRAFGKAGRAHILKNYAASDVVKQWDYTLKETLKEPKMFKRFEIYQM